MLQRQKVAGVKLALVTSCFMIASGLVGCKTPFLSNEPDLQHPLPTVDEVKSASGHDATLEELKAQMDEMVKQQQELQAKLDRQKIKVRFTPTATSNAGKGNQATASTAYIATLEDKSQFADVQNMAAKELILIPDRPAETSVMLPDDAQFIAIKIDLRYTKKRSQFLIPIESLNFEEPLLITIGACDAFIETGVTPELSPNLQNKLEFYHQPLVSCH